MHAACSSLKTKTTELKHSESQAKAHEGQEHLEQRHSETVSRGQAAQAPWPGKELASKSSLNGNHWAFLK